MPGTRSTRKRGEGTPTTNNGQQRSGSQHHRADSNSVSIEPRLVELSGPDRRDVGRSRAALSETNDARPRPAPEFKPCERHVIEGRPSEVKDEFRIHEEQHRHGDPHQGKEQWPQPE